MNNTDYINLYQLWVTIKPETVELSTWCELWKVLSKEPDPKNRNYLIGGRKYTKTSKIKW